jgi:hypothetical protein
MTAICLRHEYASFPAMFAPLILSGWVGSQLFIVLFLLLFFIINKLLFLAINPDQLIFVNYVSLEPAGYPDSGKYQVISTGDDGKVFRTVQRTENTLDYRDGEP